MEKISTVARELLVENIIPFWQGLKDEEHGGYYGYLSYDLILDKEAEKGCILNSRILWFFSEAAILLGREDLKQNAEHAYNFLKNCCWDKENGGVLWSVAYDGKALDTTKHTYNQAFAIYALSAYYRLSGDEEAISLAKEIFEIIENRCTDEVGYLESFTADWNPQPNDKLSENGVLADKTMNTLLHVFEGYAGLYQATQDEKVGRAIEHILDIYANKIYDYNLQRQKVFFDANYNSILDLYSYGHDIESSWLIDWGCALLKDEELFKNVSKINKDMAEAVYENAFNHNSLANECEKGVVDETRVWWVQAEAVIGFINLWQKNPMCDKYKQAAADIFNFILNNLIDKREGSEWFWCVDKNGNPIPDNPIVEPWKCPYHNGRMCIELIRRDVEIDV